MHPLRRYPHSVENEIEALSLEDGAPHFQPSEVGCGEPSCHSHHDGGPPTVSFRRRRFRAVETVRRCREAVGDDNLFHGDKYKWSLWFSSSVLRTTCVVLRIIPILDPAHRLMARRKVPNSIPITEDAHTK